MVAVFLDDVHHVDGDNNRNTELNKLCGEIKVSFKVGSVDYVENNVGMLADEIISRHDLLKGVGRKGIDSGKVGDDYAVVLFKLTFLFFDSNAGPVTNKLVGTGECVKQRRFSAVRIACKGNFKVHTFVPLFLRLVATNLYN